MSDLREGRKLWWLVADGNRIDGDKYSLTDLILFKDEIGWWVRVVEKETGWERQRINMRFVTSFQFQPDEDSLQ